MEEELSKIRTKDDPFVNHSLFRDIIVQAGGVAYQLDWKNQVYTFIEGDIKHFTGYSADELTPSLFESLIEIIIPLDPGGITFHPELNHQIIGENTKLYRVDYRIKTKDGRYLWVTDSAVQFRDENNELVSTVGMLLDITERKKTEDELRRNEQKFFAMFDELPIGEVYIEGDSLFFNKKVFEIIGYNNSEISTTKQWFDTLFGNQSYEAYSIYMSKKRTYVPFSEVLTIKRKDGETRLIEFFFYLHKDTEIWLLNDITEKKKAEDEISILSQLLDIAPASITVHDFDGNFLYANQKTFEMHGYTKEEYLAKNLHEIDVPESEKLINSRIEMLKREGEANFEVAHFRKDGSVFPMEVFTKIVRWGDKPVILSIATDITERKNAEEMNRRLQQTSKMEAIGRLAGGVAHDFNNLLTVIKGSISLIVPSLNENDPLYNKIKIIEEASERAEALAKQLLTFSRKQITNPSLINVNTLINDIKNMLIRIIGEDIFLEINLCDDPCIVNIDPGHLSQIIVNLSVNSRDAMPNGGKLIIETKCLTLDENYCIKHANVTPGEYVMLAVSDTGIGMDDEVKKYIFEPFFTTKKNGIGTGLGLSTVYGIVRQCNGFIECYSKPDYGTTFKIYFPRSSETEVTEIKSFEEFNDIKGDETILFVEDEDMVREMSTEYLRNLGYKVLSADNGEIAIKIANEYEGKIHLLLTDIIMPVMNGRQLSNRLSLIHPDIKTIYTSGYTQDIISHHGIASEGSEFIGKPYKLQELAKKIREILK